MEKQTIILSGVIITTLIVASMSVIWADHNDSLKSGSSYLIRSENSHDDRISFAFTLKNNSVEKFSGYFMVNDVILAAYRDDDIRSVTDSNTSLSIWGNTITGEPFVLIYDKKAITIYYEFLGIGSGISNARVELL